VTASQADFFGRRGYTSCARNAVPRTIRKSQQFAAFGPRAAAVMVKRMR